MQHWILQLAGYQDHLEQLIEKASKSKELDSEDFQALAEAFTEATEVLLRCHSEAGELRCPEMSNVQEGQKLSSILVDPQWSPPCFKSQDKIKGAQVQALLVGYQSTLERLRRVYFKGMGNILARQEQIAADYLAAVQSRSAGEAGSPAVAARTQQAADLLPVESAKPPGPGEDTGAGGTAARSSRESPAEIARRSSTQARLTTK